MKRYFLPVIIFFQCFSAEAQTYHRKVIHANETLSDYFTWLYPSFEEASVLFKNDGYLKYKVNFNMLLSTMQFIDPKGDTLEISNPENIDSIVMKTSTFFFNDGYFQIIAASDSLKLIVSRKAKFEAVKLGAMGLPARNYALTDFLVYSNSSKKEFQAIVNQDIYIHTKTEYFISTGKGELIKATKSNFLDLFNDDKKAIQDYLKLNKTNFNRQEGLEKLFHFCTHT